MQQVSEYLSVHPLEWAAIGVAVLCGGMVGLERQLRGKPVGIRTSMLITLGTYVFVAVSHYLVGPSTDASRIIGQVITGIGFLGAGVMLARDGTVIGVTSAATIWMLAAIGVCVGMHYLGLALKLAFIVVLVLVGVDLLESSFQSLTRGVHKRYQSWRDSRSK